MLSARASPSAVVLRNGRVLVLAGDSRIPVSSADNPDYGATDLYDPVANTWAATGRMNEPRNSPTAHLLASGKVLVKVDPRYFRPTDVDVLIGDASKARSRLGWKHRVGFDELVSEMVEKDRKALRAGGVYRSGANE